MTGWKQFGSYRPDSSIAFALKVMSCYRLTSAFTLPASRNASVQVPKCIANVR
jgi:hypothetical protein